MSTAPTGVSDAGLSEAIMRDLGMTLEEFNAAGDQGKRVADAVSMLRGLPGYLGTSLKDGRILVAGSGPELQEKVAELNRAGAAVGDEFVLVVPDDAPSADAPPAATGPAATGPAAASAAPELLATSIEQLYQAYLREVGASGLQAVAYANGSFIIRTGGINTAESGQKRLLAGATQPKVSPSEFVARYTNVTLELGRPIASQEDFFGGQGYRTDLGSICSAGFGAFNPAGQPLVLTAGHCADDGAARVTEIEQPAGSMAAGGTTGARAGLLGSFGFSQFGGPNNSPITGTETSPGNVGTDIAVIDALRPGLNIQPAATTWANVANPGPTAVKIIGTVSPYQGQAVCRSGRTEGWSCGSVAETGIYVAGGKPTTGTTCVDSRGVTVDPCDLRAFMGFLSYDVQSSGGDSGGPWISGNFAVGTHSAGEGQGDPRNRAIATTLEDAISHIPGGVQLQLFLNKPELTAPTAGGDVAAGQLITGQVPAAPASAVAANSKVRITIAGHAPLEVPVDAYGQWSFTAPQPAGQLMFSAETVNGFSASGASTFEVAVTPSDLLAPLVATPTENAVVTAVERIDGTGAPGATVELSGDASGSGVVGLDGHWSVAVTGEPAFGKLSVTAVQTSPGTPDSPATVRRFTVVPPVPAVTNIRDGQNIAEGSVPETITGTGLEDATVKVLIDGAAVPEVPVAGGIWSVCFPAGLEPGAHTLAVSQTMDGVVSAVTTMGFTIMAAAVPAAPPSVTVVLPAGDVDGGSGQLPDTGASAVLPAAGIAGGALLLGGLLLVLVRRRTRP